MGKAKKAVKPAPELPLRLEYRSPSELAENPANWRRHPERQLAALTDVIAEVGWAGACLYNEATGRLIDGHARKKVALAQGTDTVPVLVGNWTPEQEAKILATLDPLAAMAEADAAALDALLRDVQTASQAVGDMLTELATAAGCDWAKPEPGAGGDEFDPTPDAGPTRTRASELWVIGGKHRLLVGDCTVPENVERLMDGAAFRCMWTDPPYGVSYGAKNEFLNAISPGNRIQEPIHGDQQKPDELRAFLVLFLRTAYPFGTAGASVYVAAPPGPLHVEFIGAMGDAGIPYRHQLVWVKNQFVLGRCDYHYRHEPILYGWKDDGPHQWYGDAGTDTVFQIDKPRKNDQHPTMKPVELVEAMIRNSAGPGEVVYDPFLGSGTTLVAAHRLGRVCYGCELEPRYADVVLKRAEAEGLDCVREE